MSSNSAFASAVPSTLPRVAIVTGASRGIGRAIALGLAQNGCDILLTARDRERLDAVASEIRLLGRRAEFVVADLRERGAAAEIVAAALAGFDRIDILVNNAGATKRGDFESLTDDDWADGFALKLHGAVRLTRAAWPHLRAAHGAVVNIAGVGGRTPGSEFTIGGSVNAAVLAFTKALADVGVRDEVQVNALNPGYIRTDRFAARLQKLAAARGVTLAEAERRIVAEEQMTRIGEPADVAAAVSFIVSPAARYLHGASIDLDGGQTKTL